MKAKWLLLFNKRSKASSNMVRNFCSLSHLILDSHQSYWLRQASSLTFWESKTLTSTVNARSCSLWELSRELEEDSPTSSSKSPKSILTRGTHFSTLLISNFRAGELTEQEIEKVNDILAKPTGKYLFELRRGIPLSSRPFLIYESWAIVL